MFVLKASLICLTTLIYMGWFYFKNIKIPLHSTRIFHYLYITALIHMIADAVTVYGVNHLDTFPKELNYIFHIIFLLTIVILVFLLYLYLMSYIEHIKKISHKKKMLHAIPFIIVAILIIILPIEYVVTPQGNYSRGWKAYALYVYLICYIGLIVYYNLHFWKQLNKDKREVILSSVIVFVGVSIVQMIYPAILITAFGTLLIVLGLMLSNENVEKYIDKQTGLFNKYALNVVLDDWLLYEKKFYICIVNVDSFLYHQNLKSQQYYYQFFGEMNDQLKSRFHQQCYKVTENGLVFLSTSTNECQNILDFTKKYCEDSSLKNGFKYKIIPISNQQEESPNVMSEIITFCMDTVNKMAYIDFLTGARNRNAFELELKQFIENKKYQYYFILDANNLKTVNDTLGHSYGDEILQSIVQILTQLFLETGVIYRIGGDEFTILCEACDKTIEEWRELILLTIQTSNKQRVIPLDFAIGGALLSDPDALEKADKIMYEHKIATKKR